MSTLNFSTDGWATVNGVATANLIDVRIKKDGTGAFWHKLTNGRYSLVNVHPDGIVFQEFGRTKQECRDRMRTRRGKN